MRIFFDDQAFDSPAFGGGGRYFIELIERLALLPACEVVWYAGAYRTPLPLQSAARRCRQFYGVPTPALGPLRRMLVPGVKALGRWCLDHSGATIYHPTYYSLYPARRKVAHVVTIFDMNHERYPDFFPGSLTATNRLAALRRADAIVCISAATRNQLLEFYPDLEVKTQVIPLASSLQLPTETSPPAAGHKPYFLFVGNRGAYKNFDVLIDACRLLPRFAQDFSLKCFGGRPFSPDEQRRLVENGLDRCVEQFAGKDALLARLYRDAICFIYPSLEEGFGIPLLEAMNCRCPVLASRIPVFEEVAADAASYFNPKSAEELAIRMREMATDPEHRRALIQAGLQRASIYSWERCAQQHYALYASVEERF